eukprot:jgi/Ulvmu1/64/UM001_0067.1
MWSYGRTMLACDCRWTVPVYHVCAPRVSGVHREPARRTSCSQVDIMPPSGCRLTKSLQCALNLQPECLRRCDVIADCNSDSKRIDTQRHRCTSNAVHMNTAAMHIDAHA